MPKPLVISLCSLWQPPATSAIPLALWNGAYHKASYMKPFNSETWILTGLSFPPQDLYSSNKFLNLVPITGGGYVIAARSVSLAMSAVDLVYHFASNSVRMQVLKKCRAFDVQVSRNSWSLSFSQFADPGPYLDLMM